MSRFPLREKLSEEEMILKQRYQDLFGHASAEEILNSDILRVMIPEEFKLYKWVPKQTSDVRCSLHKRYLPVGLHTHNWLEALCVIRGTCPHRIGSRFGMLRAGDVLFISPGTTHAFLADGDDCVIANFFISMKRFNFEEVFLTFLRSKNILSDFILKTLYIDTHDSYLILHTGDYLQNDNWLAEVWRIGEERPDYWREQQASCAQLFLFDLLNHQIAPAELSLDDSNRTGNAEALTKYIETHVNSVSVQELSRVFNYSERQISRILQQYTGKSALQYIRHCRQEHFVTLLLGSDIRIERAMELCGISRSNRFYHEFQEEYGMSPAEYRKKIREGMAEI